MPLTSGLTRWQAEVVKVCHLHREQLVPGPLEEVFAFFASAENLERLTPPWLNFKIVDAPSPLTEGSVINYRLRIHGAPIRWQSRISKWRPPLLFVDEQTQGPYRLWIHEHRFERRDSSVAVIDHVQYAVWGGWIVRKAVVEKDLERIFDYRRDRLVELIQ